MAVYRIFPEKDTFISTEDLVGNAGKDEIVELGGYYDISETGQTNRILVKYSNADINNVVTNRIGATVPYQASLKFYLADAYQLPVGYTVYAYPIYRDWDSGVGKFGDIPTNTSGVSWQYRKAGELDAWEISGSYPIGVTGSYQPTTEGGGAWFINSLISGSSLEASQSYSINSDHDLNITVTGAIGAMVSGTISNEGFIVKLSDELEYNTVSAIRLKYYGADTNTIYPPSLEFKWDDSSYVTGSLSVLSTDNALINITNNKSKYTDEGKQRFRLSAKPKYPARTFSTSSVYLNKYALPQASYWGLRDENTEEMVVDFDTQFTKISCDAKGPYFDVYMDGLQPERYYRILVKTEIDGSTVVVDNKNIIKVVRNG